MSPRPDLPRDGAPTHAWDILRSERGLTLTEITVVGVLALIVMLSLTGFYFNAQRMWLETSTKATTQRDAALVMEVIGRSVHRAAIAIVDQSDPDRHRLSLFTATNVLLDEFAVDSLDDRVHHLVNGTPPDLGPVVDSPAPRLRFDQIGTNLVELSLLQLVSNDGDTVSIATRFELLGQ